MDLAGLMLRDVGQREAGTTCSHLNGEFQKTLATEIGWGVTRGGGQGARAEWARGVKGAHLHL